MKMLFKALVVATGLVAAMPAAALVVASGSGDTSTLDATQTDRVFRDGVASTWAAPKSFPGTIGGTFYYDNVAVAFAPNATQAVYYRLSYTNPSVSPFFVAYANSFDPSNIATNYLGDNGISGSGGFQVVVAAGDTLLLNFAQVGTELNSYTYTVEAFSDANFGETFGAVPEPATWALMLGGFGMVGFAARRRRSVVAA